MSVTVALQGLPDTPRDEVEIRARSPFLGAKVANLSPALADELRLDPQAEGVVITRRRRRLDGAIARLSEAANRASRSTIRRSPRPADLERVASSRQPAVAHHHHARRPADIGGVQRMSPRAQSAKAPSLFAAAGLERDAPRPLADRLRPDKLAEVVGQDHLLGPDGALTRMLATRSLGSLIFWGPPGTGKTTVARLLAQATELHFEQISAIFSGVADLKKVFEAARAAPRDRAGHAALRRRNPSLQPRAAGFVSCR